MESRKFFDGLPVCLLVLFCAVSLLCKAYARFLLIFFLHMFHRFVCLSDRLSIYSFIHSSIHLRANAQRNQCMCTYFMHVWINECTSQCTFCKWQFFCITTDFSLTYLSMCWNRTTKADRLSLSMMQNGFFGIFPTRKTQQVIRFCKCSYTLP